MCVVKFLCIYIIHKKIAYNFKIIYNPYYMQLWGVEEKYEYTKF
tara:strand:- start:1365 stop:1496 length:132 start_codon:yes stop_codon:yes gene_type:complete